MIGSRNTSSLLSMCVIAASLLVLAGAPGSRAWADAAAKANAEAEADADADADAEAEADADAEAEAEAEGWQGFPPELLEKLDPETASFAEGLDSEGIAALFGKAESGQELSEQERILLEAIAELSNAAFQQELDFQSGAVSVGDGLATISLGEDYMFVGPEDSQRILVEAWGNPPGSDALGMIFPKGADILDEKTWGVVITYSDDGHVDDDDAEDIDYDELLEQMQESTEAENPARKAQGYPALHILRWAETPHYDGNTHRLYWAKELKFDGDDAEHTLNYSIRVLGRTGVLELNAVSAMSQLAAIKAPMEDLLTKVEFADGRRYGDFDPDIDKVAAYGIGGLIAGKVLAKAGILAFLAKILIAGKKFFILIVVGLFGGIRWLLGRRRED